MFKIEFHSNRSFEWSKSEICFVNFREIFRDSFSFYQNGRYQSTLKDLLWSVLIEPCFENPLFGQRLWCFWYIRFWNLCEYKWIRKTFQNPVQNLKNKEWMSWIERTCSGTENLSKFCFRIPTVYSTGTYSKWLICVKHISKKYGMFQNSESEESLQSE